jgi:hypothetical protein
MKMLKEGEEADVSAGDLNLPISEVISTGW